MCRNLTVNRFPRALVRVQRSKRQLKLFLHYHFIDFLALVFFSVCVGREVEKKGGFFICFYVVVVEVRHWGWG